jgi:hypothetical protein
MQHGKFSISTAKKLLFVFIAAQRGYFYVFQSTSEVLRMDVLYNMWYQPL